MEISAEPRTYHHFNNHKTRSRRLDPNFMKNNRYHSQKERKEEEGGGVPRTTKPQKSRFKRKKSKKVKIRVKENYDSYRKAKVKSEKKKKYSRTLLSRNALNRIPR